jgi:hypothetical protein
VARLRAVIGECQLSRGIVEIEAKGQAVEGREYRPRHIRHPPVRLTELVLQVISLVLRGLEEGIAESGAKRQAADDQETITAAADDQEMITAAFDVPTSNPHARVRYLAGDLPFQILMTGTLVMIDRCVSGLLWVE